MPTTVERFIDKCMDIVKAKPVYSHGCSNTSKCDCIGMIKYGLKKNKVTLTSTGTNDTFRTKVINSHLIHSVSDLQVGDVVFKCKKPGETGYALPAKYQKGKSAYNGDLTDYTHIGVVKGLNPLRIIHMTSPTAKTDTTIGKWKYAAQLKPVYISSEVPADPEPSVPETPSEPAADVKKATVYASNGLPVKIRKEPTVTCNIYDVVPCGVMITVEADQGYWTKVSYGSRKGWYMMTKFLKFV